MTNNLKTLNSKELGSLKTLGPNGRGRHRETAKAAPREMPIPGRVLLPSEGPPRSGREKKAPILYRVAVRLNREAPVSLKDVIGELEKKVIVRVLNEVDGNQKNAARILGMKYTTLNEKVKRYQIRVRKISIIE